MARGPVPITVLNAAGAPVAGAAVSIRKRPDAAQTLYATEEGVSTLANPATANPQGRVPGWLPKGNYTANVTGTGITAYSEHFDIRPADYLIPTISAPDPLPTSPEVGDEIYYMPSPKIRWHLRRSTTWDFVGGSPLRVFSGSMISQSGTITLTAVAGGPQVSFPFLGTYNVEASTHMITIGGGSLEFGAVPAINNVPVNGTKGCMKSVFALNCSQSMHWAGDVVCSNVAQPLHFSLFSEVTRTIQLHELTLAITARSLT